MEDLKLKPSDFMGAHPFDSLMQKSESETIARNIMAILGRTGNKFRLLNWDEYKKERLKDGNFNEDGSLGEGRKAHLLLLINGINNFPVPVGNRKQLNLPGFISNIALTASISKTETIVKRQK